MIKPQLVVISIIGLAAMSSFRAGAQSVATPEDTYSVKMKLSQEAIAEGDKQFKDKHYDVAVREYQFACDNLPETPLTHVYRARAIDGFSQAGVKLAEQCIAEGRYEDADFALQKVLESKYNPNYKPAIQLIAHMEDLLFKDAKSFYDAGRYDLAYKCYDRILDMDPYNVEARKGQEKVIVIRAEYIDGNHPLIRVDAEAINLKNQQSIQHKLDHIVIPKIEFKETTVREAIALLHKKSLELDTTETDPNRKGVNIVLKLQSAPGTGGAPDAPAVSPADIKLTFSLTNVTLAEAFHDITVLAGLKIKIDPYAVTVVPLSEPTDVFLTKEWKVPPEFLNTASSTPKQMTALAFLMQAGVQFPPGAGANFLPSSSKLVVRNTVANLDLVDQIVDALTAVNAPEPAEKSTSTPTPVPSEEKDAE